MVINYALSLYLTELLISKQCTYDKQYLEHIWHTDRRVALCIQQCQVVHALFGRQHHLYFDQLPSSLLVHSVVLDLFLPGNRHFIRHIVKSSVKYNK